MPRLLPIAVMLAVAAATLAGCGVKGPPEPPPAAVGDGTAPAAPAKKTHDGFILDPIL